MIGSRLGPYQITGKLGEGGMGEVYRATDSNLKREVAIKVLPAAFIEDKERLARFEREAQLLAQLHHPNIASIFGLEVSGGARALVMELVEGPTLADRLSHGALPVEEALAIARQIAEALEAAHEKGIVHRDLKPQNIKVALDGTVKVLDFGLAKAFEPNTGAPTTSPTLMNSPTLTAAGTQLGVILGTAAYMAPEQARGLPVDRRADIWAFGAVLFEMVSGKRLFAGDTVSDTLAAVLRAEVDWSALPTGTPASLRRLLARCLDRDRKRRLHDIGDTHFELEEALARGEAPASEPVPAGRRGWLFGILAAALALAAGFGLARFLAAPPADRGALRLVLPAPEGMTFYDVPVISPDGRKVAFMARTGPAKLAVFGRGLDGAATPPLAELTGALDSPGARPFWSPDSSAVGFCDGAKLRIAELAGAALRTLGDCERTYRNGDWGDDGTIVYAPSSNSGILAVPAAGGAVKPATPFDDKVPDLSHRYPHFLPGGRRFLYLAWSNAADAPEEAVGLFVGDLDTGKARRLSDARSNVALVGEGAGLRLLFRRERGLVALDFDPRKLVLGGGEVTVERELQWWASGGYSSFSATLRGDVMTLPPQDQQAYLLNIVDRQGTDQEQINLAAIYVDYAVSPDGKRLAATILDPSRGLTDIWVIDLERQVSTRLTQGRDGHKNPVWFPDGKTIAFSTGEATGLDQPFAVAADGSSPMRRLAETPGRDTPTAISPDGQWMLLAREASPRNSEMWAHSLRDGHEVAICRNASGNCENGIFSPDGRYVAFSSDFSGRPEIYVRAFLAEGAQVQLSSAGGDQPHWRADGGEIVFRDPEGWDVAAEISTVPRLEVKPARRLKLSGPDTLVAPFPDHSRFFNKSRGAGGATEAHAILGWR